MNSTKEEKIFKLIEDGDSGFDNAYDSSNSCESSESSNCDEYLDSDVKTLPSCEKGYRRHERIIIIKNLRGDPKGEEDEEKNSCENSGENDCALFFRACLNKSDADTYGAGVKEFYENLIAGQYETVDFGIGPHSEKPTWLDVEKFKRGQVFARYHLFCINFAEMLSLFILFAQKSSLGPLIFTEKSDSPFTAFRRYLSTLTKLISWYSDDVWDDNVDSQGRRNLHLVRAMHESVYKNLTRCPEEELKKRTTLGDPESTALWCPLRDSVVADFRDSVSCPAWIEDVAGHDFNRKVWVSQTDMSLTQFGFVGLAVTYPKDFGIHLATEEDLDAFAHMWRGLGYLLGIKDEYNFCGGDLTEVRKRTRFFIESVAKPAFRNATCDWEHMSRCLTAGIANYVPGVSFEGSLLYLCRILKVETPRLRKKMGFSDYLVYLLHIFVFYLMKYSSVSSWLNARIYYLIGKAQTAPPEILQKWEKKEYAYMNQPGKCPIRKGLSYLKT